MTQKHYIALINHIKDSKYFDRFTPAVMETLADFYETENPRFSRDIFLGYFAGTCGPSGGKRK